MSDGPERPESPPDTTKSMTLPQVGPPMGGSGPLAQHQHQLQPGDVMAGRFVIIQFLARGGMGEVYEATDPRLQNKHCALKTVRPEIAANPAARLRFEREVLMAREVLHPNVCPTYDIFHDDGPRGPVMFLTMKLLRGESLDSRLRRSGCFGPDAALPLARQMAAGLDAAHRAGVIHRDFKPGNVMLEYAGEETRVSITDFGLSRAYDAESSLADTGAVSGTLGYIAPEVLEGRIASPVSDVFSFGVVLHELLTGRKPVKRLGRTSYVAPSSLLPGIPRVWDRVILGCLEHEADRRFHSASEALAVIEARSGSTRSIALRRPISRRRMALAVAAGAWALAAAAWWKWSLVESLVHPLPAKRFVALMAWPADMRPQDRPLLNGVLGAVGARLARSEATVTDLLVISSSDVTGQAPVKSPSEAVSALGANLVLAASLRPARSGFTLTLQVLDAATGRRIRYAEIPTSLPALADLTEKASTSSVALLGLPASHTKLNDQDELAHIPPAAFQAFTTADELMRQPNDAGLEQAIETYQKTLETAPRFAVGYARLAMAYIRRHFKSGDRAALGLAAKNADLAMRYNPDSPTAVLSRGLVDLYGGNTADAMDAFGKALRLDPGNSQILLYKAVALRDLGRRAEEERTYREIIEERPNFWPAYNELGWLLSRDGDYQKAADAYEKGAAVAPRVALPLASLGTMYLNLRRNNEAEDAFRQSLLRAPSDQAYFGLGDITFEAADYRGALGFYLKASGLKPKSHIAWRDIGDCYAMLGDGAQVGESYAKAASILSDLLRTNPQRGKSWMTLAFYEAKLGRRSEAEADIRKAEERGATDAKAQLEKAEALALLGRKEESVLLVLECMKKGISPVEVELAIDLKEIRADSRYRAFVAQHQPR